jgi:hypothetical protein
VGAFFVFVQPHICYHCVIVICLQYDHWAGYAYPGTHQCGAGLVNVELSDVLCHPLASFSSMRWYATIH